MMKSLFEELGGTYPLGKDGMYYPELALDGSNNLPLAGGAGCT